jgi:hypothetical protein
MLKRLAISMILFNLILSALIPVSSSVNNVVWWNENWSYRQEIILPINTSSEVSKYQPIDIRIKFDNLCWTKNKKEHSVRVIFQNDGNFKELESQIYELNYIDDTHINACNLVFLIPGEAIGTEQYFIYYDANEKQGPDYPDHVNIEESYYRYEPIQGYPFESWYYKIVEDGYIVYAITQEGKFMKSRSSQQVTKLQPNSESVLPKNGEQMASFEFKYWHRENENWIEHSTLERFVSKEIFVDGNLMVKFGIVSRSSEEEFQSTVIYKYYYCPAEDKRIRVHVKHEILTYPIPAGDRVDVFYATLTSGVFRSSSVSDLNFGEILPYLHVYGEEGQIIAYDLDPYPENYWEKVISNDCDLGNRSWASIDRGKTGKAHSLIFGSTNVIQSGTNERDGIQTTAFESKDLQLPGIDTRFAYVYFGRNSSEEGLPRELELPEDFVVEFDAEFFTTEKGGYLSVDEEARLYQSLVQYMPVSDSNVSDGEEKQVDKYVLTVVPHLPASLSLQFMFSALTGENPYVWAELYQDNELIASGRCSRISFTDNKKIDWKNSSLFRKISFPNLIPGKYLVKIWIKDSSTEKQRKFIGFQIVELQKKDLKINIFCKPEGTVLVSVNDQNNNTLENAKVSLLMNNVIISENSSINGTAVIKAPCNPRNKYQLKVIYKGFVAYNGLVRLGYLESISPVEKLVKFDVYDLVVKVRNGQSAAPTFNMDVTVTSKDMQEPVIISAEKISNGEYNFIALYPAKYNLTIRYNSFEVKEKVEVPATKLFDVNLYDLRINVKDSWGLSPGYILDVTLHSKDLEKTVVLFAESLSNETYSFSDLYPGRYLLKLRYKSFEMEKPVSIPSSNNDEDLNLIFSVKFNVAMNVLDARGNPLTSVKVLMIRDDNERERITNGNGETLFSLPPGLYVSKIYSDNRLIAERKVDVTKDKTVVIVTVEEPPLPVMIVGLAMLLAIATAFFSYRKKDIVFLLTGIVVALAVISIVSPWWAIQGSSSEVGTSSKLYLIPARLVTITSSSDVIAGELTSLDETILSGLNSVFLLAVVGCILVSISLFFRWWNKNSYSSAFLLIGATTYICSLAVFFYRISDVVSIGLGSSFGNGNLNINVPGEEMYVQIFCSWGPGIGFYLCLVSVVIIFSILILYIRKYYCRK